MFTKITKTAGATMFMTLAFAAFSFGVSTVNAQEAVVEVVLVSENSLELCSDGEDNDDNGSQDAADANCAEFLSEPEEIIAPVVLENSFALCHDSVDNDDNGSQDMADVNCANFATDPEAIVPVTENSYELCHDGIDNDDNGSQDMADVNCADHANNPADNGGNDDNDSNSSRRGGSKKKVPTGNLSSGEVLGATTDGSCPMLLSYMKEGQANNVDQVKLLQSFLNKEMGLSLPTTGFFGALTNKAVEDFQLKYKEEILKPWVDLGLHSSINIPTGYVYKTTSYKINTMLCPDAEIAKPVLN